MPTDEQEREMYQGWIGGDATVWCQEGHSPKIVQENGTEYVCPECNATYRIDVVVSKT